MRSSTAVPRLRRRPARAIPAAVAATLVGAVGVGLIVLPIVWLTGGTAASSVTSGLAATGRLTWSSWTVIGVAAGLLILGLLALGAGIVPGRFAVVPIDARSADGSDSGAPAPNRGSEYVLSRRGMVRLAAAAAEQVSGVSSVASASAGASSVILRVRTSSSATAELSAQIRTRVAARLADAGIRRPPRIRTNVRVDN